MNEKVEIYLIRIIYVALAALALILFFIIIPRDLDSTRQARDWAKTHGCEYIGSPRDLTSVKFFNCSGVVQLRKFDGNP